MKMTLVPQQYFDGDGNPLVGRLSVFDRSTDVPGTDVSGKYTKIYTFADGEYSDAANPQFLDSEGRLPSSVYFDAAVVSVRLERYTGDSSMGSDDDPEHWETVDTYDAGMEWDDPAPTASVGSVEELKNAPVAMSPVLVTGYYRDGDCPARIYLWDADCTVSQDGGYVVKSSVSDSGRWVMLWGCDTLPCTLYGVFPGKLDNLNALFGYAESVGTAGLATARKIRFVNGDYETGALDYLTGKELAFDEKARFTGTGIVKCPRVRVKPGGNGFAADFVFTSVNEEAHSSWFRTMDGFFGCKGRKLVIDATSYFHASGRSLSGKKVIEYAEIEARTVLSEKYADMYGDGAYLYLDHCSIGGTLFGPKDNVVFLGMTFERTWFRQDMRLAEFRFGKIADGARIQVLSSDGNVLDIFRFVSADVYIKAIVADGQTSVSLCGKTASSLPDEIVAASCGSLGIVERSSGTLSLSDIDIGTADVSGCALSLDRVRIFGGKIAKSRIDARSCSFSCEIVDQSDADGYEGACPVTAYDSYFSTQVGAENISLAGCKVNGKVSVRPFLDSGNRTVYYAAFDGCVFLGDGMLEFLPPIRSSTATSWTQIEAAAVSILDCRFAGTSAEGVSMPRFVYRGDEYGTGAVKLFANDAEISYEYRGNSGNCPLEAVTGRLSNLEVIELDGANFATMLARVFYLGAGKTQSSVPHGNMPVYSHVATSGFSDMNYRYHTFRYGEPATTAWPNDQFYGRLEIGMEKSDEGGVYLGMTLR